MNKVKSFGLLGILLLTLLATAGLGKTARSTGDTVFSAVTRRGCGGPNCRDLVGCTGPDCRNNSHVEKMSLAGGCDGPDCRNLVRCTGPNCRNNSQVEKMSLPGGCGSPDCRNLVGCTGPSCRNN